MFGKPPGKMNIAAHVTPVEGILYSVRPCRYSKAYNTNYDGAITMLVKKSELAKVSTMLDAVCDKETAFGKSLRHKTWGKKVERCIEHFKSNCGHPTDLLKQYKDYIKICQDHRDERSEETQGSKKNESAYMLNSCLWLSRGSNWDSASGGQVDSYAVALRDTYLGMFDPLGYSFIVTIPIVSTLAAYDYPKPQGDKFRGLNFRDEGLNKQNPEFCDDNKGENRGTSGGIVLGSTPDKPTIPIYALPLLSIRELIKAGVENLLNAEDNEGRDVAIKSLSWQAAIGADFGRLNGVFTTSNALPPQVKLNPVTLPRSTASNRVDQLVKSTQSLLERQSTNKDSVNDTGDAKQIPAPASIEKDAEEGDEF